MVGIYTCKKGINRTTRTYSLDTNCKIQKGATGNTVVEGIFKAMRGWGLELWIVVGVEDRNNSILVLFEGASVILGCIAFVIGILFDDKLERI